jgi:hypothetical protein
MSDKAIVILTSFWNANYMIDLGYAVFPLNKEQMCKININPKEPNFSVHSIALRHPTIDKKLPHLNGITTLDVFCPTYDMLRRYKDDGDWASYTKDYRALLSKRKIEIREWLNSLKPNYIYILCCWENTSLKVHCHRQLLYEAFKNSTLAKEKILPFYCDGKKKVKEEEEVFYGGRNFNTTHYDWQTPLHTHTQPITYAQPQLVSPIMYDPDPYNINARPR